MDVRNKKQAPCQLAPVMQIWRLQGLACPLRVSPKLASAAPVCGALASIGTHWDTPDSGLNAPWKTLNLLP